MRKVKCRWKFCPRITEEGKHELNIDEALKDGKNYFCKDCYEQYMQLKQIREIYGKHVSNTESWQIINKSLNNWIPKFGVEYILFVLCKAIKNKDIYREDYASIFSMYKFLVSNKYKIMYQNYKNDNDTRQYGEFVALSNVQYRELLEQFNKEKIQRYIDKINIYCKQSGREYRDYKIAILEWIKRDQSKYMKIHG